MICVAWLGLIDGPTKQVIHLGFAPLRLCALPHQHSKNAVQVGFTQRRKGAKCHDEKAKMGKLRGELGEPHPFAICHLPFVMCHVSCVMCHVPYCHIAILPWVDSHRPLARTHQSKQMVGTSIPHRSGLASPKTQMSPRLGEPGRAALQPHSLAGRQCVHGAQRRAVLVSHRHLSARHHFCLRMQ